MAVNRWLVLSVVAACGGERASEPASRPERPRQTIRVAIVGGMMETGFWPELAARYERTSGDTIELAAAGPKPQVIAAFKQGGIDLITVHASDAMVNLVADGFARDPQPWVKNDLVIVGPAADPAGIRGSTDAIAALTKIIATRSRLLVHASLGADTVLHDLQEAGKLELVPEATLMFADADQHAVLERAATEGAYTIVGRIPFLRGKLKADGIVLMVTGDPLLRRPYLVQVSTKAQAGADDLAAYLRSPATQAWIATFGKGTYDDEPLFFPVVIPQVGARPPVR